MGPREEHKDATSDARRDAMPQTRLPQQNLLPTALEAESPGSRCQQAGFLLSPPYLVAVATLPCDLTWPFLWASSLLSHLIGSRPHLWGLISS